MDTPKVSTTIVLGLMMIDQFATAMAFQFGIAHAANDRIVSVGFFPGFLIAVGLLFFMRSRLPAIPDIAFYLMGAGIASNMLTFMVRNTVYDYIPTPWTYTNAADLLIVVGCGVAAYSILKSTFRRPV